MFALDLRIYYLLSFLPSTKVDALSGSRLEVNPSSNSAFPGQPQRYHHIEAIPRVRDSDFSPTDHYYRSFPYGERDDAGVPYETPVVVENVLDSDECEAICDSLLSSFGSNEITVQRKQRRREAECVGGERRRMFEIRKADDSTEMITCTLLEAIELMMDSSHDDCFFAFCEGLLDSFNHKNVDVLNLVRRARETLFESSRRNDANGRDLFEFFPSEIRPTDCLVLAGEGATSTLHRDPFEWTGLSLCLEGSKIWRFVPPPVADVASATNLSRVSRKEVDVSSFADVDDSGVGFVDDRLNSYRLESSAWDDDDEGTRRRVPLSAGWQSDKTLFARRRKHDYVSPRSLADLGHDARRNYLESIAMDPRAISSNVNDQVTSGAHSNSDENSRVINRVWTTVQQPGDLLIIPAYWWHQTYAPEPSLAVATQRCGAERDLNRVFNHIMKTSGQRNSCEINLRYDDPKSVVDFFFQDLSSNVPDLI